MDLDTSRQRGQALHRNIVTCDICHRQFVNGRFLDQHFRQVHDEVRPFLCHLCPAKFKTPNDLEEHVESCGQESSSSDALVVDATAPNTEPVNDTEDEVKSVTEGTSVVNAETASEDEHAQIRKLHSAAHNAVKRLARSKTVAELLQARRDMDARLQRKPSDSAYENGGAAVIKHETGLSNQPLEPFRCLPCDCKLSSIAGVEKHLADVSHDGEVEVGCDLCDMKFSVTKELEEHVRSFVCPIDASGKWKGFGTMPSLPNGSLDIFDPKVHKIEVGLPNLFNLPGLGLLKRKAENGTKISTKVRVTENRVSDSDEETGNTETHVGAKALLDQKRQKKKHVCNVCEKSYDTLNDFTRHYRKHARGSLMPPRTEVRPLLKYPCNMCSKSFSCFEELYNHRRVHTGETPFACRYCDQAYVDITGLQYHMFSAHAWSLNAIKLIRCRVMKYTSSSSRSCQARFFDIKGLRQHCIISHQDIQADVFPCACERCNQDFASADMIEDHIRLNECDLGAKLAEWLSETPMAFGTDMITPESGATIAPSVPISRIKNSRETQGRRRDLRVRIERSTKCPRCRKRFERLDVLRDHYNSRCDGRFIMRNPRKGEKSSRCEACDLVFWSRESFNQHMRLHVTMETTESDQFKKKCSLCDRVFNNVNEFFEHYKSHATKTKKQMQDEAPTVASQQVDHVSNVEPTEGRLESLANDGGDRKIKFQKTCTVCSRVFSQLNSFIEHYRSHQSGDERRADNKYSCCQCSAKFLSRQVYLNHIKIHTGERPYACRFCTEAFTNELTLGLHIPAAHFKTKFFKIYEPPSKGNAGSQKTISSINELKTMNVSKFSSRKNWFCKCLQCDSTFATQKAVKKHILGQTCAVTFREVLLDQRSGPSTSLLCKICGNLYDQEDGLRKHMKNMHTVSGSL